ncbi:MFS transporter, partial [Actinosynnema sp. NPDC023658]|uniref:MFS transporter n=1 Tax=Actinosynnema sp. NPDC023658 TaxID=3155465 RepID=UPI003410ED56
LSLLAIVLPLVEGPRLGWPWWTWPCLASAAPLLGAFTLRQHRLRVRAGSPLVDLAMFRERSYWAGLVIGLVYALAMSSFFLVLALYLQQGHGLGALDSGLIFLPLGLGYFVASTRSGAVAAVLGRQVLALGSSVVAAGYAVLAVTVDRIGVTGPVPWLIPGLLVSGAGMGLVMAPLPSIVMAGVARRHSSAASGVLNAVQQAGGAIGVALVGLVFYRVLGATPTPADHAAAFTHSQYLLAGFAVAVVALVQLLPKPAARPGGSDVQAK